MAGAGRLDRHGGPCLLRAQTAGQHPRAWSDQVGDGVDVLVQADDHAGSGEFARSIRGEQVPVPRAEADDRQPAAGTMAGHRHGRMRARPLGHDQLGTVSRSAVGAQQARRLGDTRRADGGPDHLGGMRHVDGRE